MEEENNTVKYVNNNLNKIYTYNDGESKKQDFFLAGQQGSIAGDSTNLVFLATEPVGDINASTNTKVVHFNTGNGKLDAPIHKKIKNEIFTNLDIYKNHKYYKNKGEIKKFTESDADTIANIFFNTDVEKNMDLIHSIKYKDEYFGSEQIKYETIINSIKTNLDLYKTIVNDAGIELEKYNVEDITDPKLKEFFNDLTNLHFKVDNFVKKADAEIAKPPDQGGRKTKRRKSKRRKTSHAKKSKKRTNKKGRKTRK